MKRSFIKSLNKTTIAITPPIKIIVINPFPIILEYYHYDFVRNALLAGSIIGILGAIIGYFVVIRNNGFTVHALTHIGFTGATGALLLGIVPLHGMLLLSSISSFFIGWLGNRLHKSEIATGMVLAFSLGLGTLFLALNQGAAGSVTSLLFGNIFGVSWEETISMTQLTLVALLLLGLFSRKILFASLQPEVAQAKQLSLPLLSILFTIIVGISTSLASQVVGVLLVFALIIGPASIATRFTSSFWSGIITSVVIALGSIWLGITLACITNWPPSFWITSLLFIGYLLSELYSAFSD